MGVLRKGILGNEEAALWLPPLTEELFASVLWKVSMKYFIFLDDWHLPSGQCHNLKWPFLKYKDLFVEIELGRGKNKGLLS